MTSRLLRDAASVACGRMEVLMQGNYITMDCWRLRTIKSMGLLRVQSLPCMWDKGLLAACIEQIVKHLPEFAFLELSIYLNICLFVRISISGWLKLPTKGALNVWEWNLPSNFVVETIRIYKKEIYNAGLWIEEYWYKQLSLCFILECFWQSEINK